MKTRSRTHSDGHGTRVVERTRVVPSSTPGGLNTRAIYAKDTPGVAFVQSPGITTDTPFGRERGVATGSGFAVGAHKPGQTVTIDYLRHGARRTASTTLARHPTAVLPSSGLGG
jgi:hypothetical protein